MKRTQIQIPDPLYKEVKRLAALRDWSVSEVIRRAVEELVAKYPGIKQRERWEPPRPRNLGKPKIPAERWRDLLVEEQTGGTEAL
jgi:Arc/MetJ-type ribon-helix-helix transcriptional regulator